MTDTPKLPRYDLQADQYSVVQESASEDGAWVKWSDLAAYCTQEEADLLAYFERESIGLDDGSAFGFLDCEITPPQAAALRGLAAKIRALLPPAP